MVQNNPAAELVITQVGYLGARLPCYRCFTYILSDWFLRYYYTHSCACASQFYYQSEVDTKHGISPQFISMHSQFEKGKNEQQQVGFG